MRLIPPIITRGKYRFLMENRSYKKALLLVAIVLLSFLAACKGGSDTNRKVDMYNQSGDLVGTATLTEHPDGVNIHLKVEGISEGFHGLHVHESPVCDLPDFKNAGNHFNPEGKEHGLMNPKGAHLGDLPNVEADNNGKIDVELILAGATLLEGKNSLLKKGGTSLIITEESDDGMSQPAGNSGIRIICGEIKEDKTDKKAEAPTDPAENSDEDKEGS